MGLNLEALQVYLTVVECGSFAGAAAALAISRATAARRVEELEASAGIALLIRTPTGIMPTHAGTELAMRGKHIIASASALLSSTRTIGTHPTGVIRIVIPLGIPVELSTMVFGMLFARWPDLCFTTHHAETPLAVLLAQADVALTYDLEVPPGPWKARDLLPVPDTLMASATYLASHPPINTVADLAGHRLLVHQGLDEDGTRLPLRDHTHVGITPAFVTNRGDLVYQMAASGLGIGFAPRARNPAPNMPLLEAVLPGVVGRERWARLVVPEGVDPLPRVKVMVDACVHFAERLRAASPDKR